MGKANERAEETCSCPKGKVADEAKLLRTVVNNIREALICISDDGKITLYNAAALDMLDTNRNLIGATADDLFHLVDSHNDPIPLSEVIRGVELAIERTDLKLEDAEDHYINLRLNIIPIKQGYTSAKPKSGGTIVMAADITREKSLDDERDEFIAVVSHELRTPVAIAEGALSNLQLLLKRGGDPKLFSSTLNSAHKQILYLGQMVNDLSTLSRAQRGLYMDDDEIDIISFIQSLYQKYHGDAEEKHLILIADAEVNGKVIVPNMVIEEIMQNMITNAIKYTSNGKVVVGAMPSPKKAGYVRFYVKDSGIGISPEDQKHIFERFWRSEDYRTRKTSGTGLGLHVVDQLAQKINARVEVESKLNVGSTFSIDLPLKR